MPTNTKTITNDEGTFTTRVGSRLDLSTQQQPTSAASTVPSPISVDSLQTPTVPFKVTPPAPSTSMTGLGGAIESNAYAFTKDLESKAKAAEIGKESSLSVLTKQMLNAGGEVALTNKAYADTVDPLETELKDINQQIFAEQQSTRREIENLRKNPAGFVGQGLENRIRDIENASISKEADLSVIQLARQGKYDSAKAIADRAVAARLEKQRSELEVLKLNYEDNKDQFTKAEQREFETKQADRERALDIQKTNLKQISDLSIDALQNGAPASVAAQMQQATSIPEAIKIGGQYIGLLQRQAAARTSANVDLARRKDLLQLALVGDQAAIKELGYDPKNLPLTAKEITNFEDQKSVFKRDLDIASRALANETGLQNSTGFFKGGVAGAFLETPGGILGAPSGMIKKQDFLNDAQYIIKNLTFNKIKELSDQGIKLTPISEKELKAMADASSVLASSVISDDAGNVVGFRGSEARVREQLKLVTEHYQKAIDDITTQTMLSTEDRDEVARMK